MLPTFQSYSLGNRPHRPIKLPYAAILFIYQYTWDNILRQLFVSTPLQGFVAGTFCLFIA